MHKLGGHAIFLNEDSTQLKEVKTSAIQPEYYQEWLI